MSNPFEELCDILTPSPQSAAGAIGTVSSGDPLIISVHGLNYTEERIRSNALLQFDEDSAGKQVLLCTLDSWQTIILICEVI